MLVIIVCRQGLCVGLIKNPCYSITKSGELTRLDREFLCQDRDSKYDNVSASGYSEWANPYQIQIDINNEKRSIFELNDYRHFSDISAEFPSVQLTTLNTGDIVDHTFCRRYIYKTKPLTKNDSQKCITINKNICGKLNDEVRKDTELYGVAIKLGINNSLNEKEVENCAGIMSRAQNAFSSVFNNKDQNYMKLAGDRYKSIKTFADKQIRPEMKKALNWTYNESATDANSGLEEINQTSFIALNNLRNLYSKCVELFPSESANIKAPGDKTVQTKTDSR
jgi:hypothetical protein